MQMGYLHRRKFVKLSAFAFLGVCSARCMPLARNVFHYVPLLAEGLGYIYAAKTINDFLTNQEQLREVQGDMAHVQEEMANGGFSGRESDIYKDGQQNFIHGFEHIEGIDGCIAFYDPNNGGFRTMIEGPSIIGIAKASRDARLQGSKEISKQLFRPLQSINDNRGTLASGYSTPTEYLNLSGGTTSIWYDKIINNRGRISVRAVSGPGLSSPQDFERDYEIDFPIV